MATPGAQNSIFAPDQSSPSVIFADQVAPSTIRVYFSEPITTAGFEPSNFSQNGVSPQTVAASNQATEAVLEFAASLSADFLVIGALIDVTGNESADITVEIARLPSFGDVVVNEIMFDPRSNDDDGLADQPEYLELFNTTGKLISLSQVFWTDNPNEDGEADTTMLSVIPSAIQAQNFAVVFSQSGALSADEIYSNSLLVEAFPLPFASMGVTLLHINASSLGLLNDGDLVRLETAAGTILDEVFYDEGWHHPNLRESKGVSLERIDPRSAGDTRLNWNSSVEPSGGSPGQENTIFLSPDAVFLDAGIVLEPATFSPDQDGFDDIVSIQYSLESTPSLVRIRIFDSKGRIVRNLEEARLSAETGSVFWDGLDNNGYTLPVGIYIVLLDAIDSSNGATEKYKAAVVLARQLD